MDTAASDARGFSSGSTIGFAIPINSAASIAQQIASGHGSGTIRIGLPAFLGVQIQSTGSAGSGLGNRGSGFGGFGGSTAPSTNGAVITAVPSGTPAQSAGLAAGDTIVSIDGKAIGSADDLSTALSAHRPGDSVQVGWVDQSGQSHTATVRLASGPAD
jgi:S1-C subfamily serine protease